MAFSTPSRYVRNIFAQNEEDETFHATKILA
jgi:hypothetical protein